MNLSLQLAQRLRLPIVLAGFRTPTSELEGLLAQVGERRALTPALFGLHPGATVTLDPKPQGFFTVRLRAAPSRALAARHEHHGRPRPLPLDAPLR